MRISPPAPTGCVKHAGCATVYYNDTFTHAPRAHAHAHAWVHHAGACQGLFDEIEYVIGSIDPRKRIDVGGFRMDAKGKQVSKSIPYATSETHLTEVRMLPLT